jgi:GH15 family glucan-1,4-alpha-glucosidase
MALPGEEEAFLLCSFWLVDALTFSRRADEALAVFENVVDYANPLGLFSEEIQPSTGAHLGNTPQTFSHIGLVNSVLYLESVLGEEVSEPLPRGVDASSGIEQ